MSLFNFNSLRIVFCITLVTACNSGSAEKKDDIPTNKSVGDEAGNSKQSVNDEPIELSGLKISYKKYSAEKCYDPIPSEDEEFQDTEPFCAKREVKLIDVYLTNTEISDKINANIFKGITGQEIGSIKMKSFVNEVYDLDGYENAFEEEIICESEDFNEAFISIIINTNMYMNGAAHPANHIDIKNFDLKTGEIILLKDLFKPGYQKKLKMIVEKKFIKEFGSDDWDFTPRNGSFKLSDNFSIGKKGLSFIYNEYEIGPYSSGAPDVTISWKDLLPLMKENLYIELEL